MPDVHVKKIRLRRPVPDKICAASAAAHTGSALSSSECLCWPTLSLLVTTQQIIYQTMIKSTCDIQDASQEYVEAARFFFKMTRGYKSSLLILTSVS